MEWLMNVLEFVWVISHAWELAVTSHCVQLEGAEILAQSTCLLPTLGTEFIAFAGLWRTRPAQRLSAIDARSQSLTNPLSRRTPFTMRKLGRQMSQMM